MNNRTTSRTSSTPKWKFTSLVELNAASTAILRQAIIHERCKQWKRVVECYKHLLWTVSLDNLPANYDPPARYGTLIYEVQYHLGVALQRTGEHRKAITCYTKAIDAVSHSKNDCSGGCVTSSCLMTPLFARRAFTYAKTGDLKSAIKDAERAVILDGTNPDVYCVRALVRSTRDEVVDVSARWQIQRYDSFKTVWK